MLSGSVPTTEGMLFTASLLGSPANRGRWRGCHAGRDGWGVALGNEAVDVDGFSDEVVV